MSRKLNFSVLALVAALGAGWVPAHAADAATSNASTRVIQVQPDYTPAMQKLMDAAQRLRESIQAMAQKPPGPERDLAIAKANEALLTTQRAMLDLPPQLRAHGTVASTDYDSSVKALMKAADTLRESVQAMARQPAGTGRNQAIRDVDRALLDTQVAMANAYDSTAKRAGTRVMGANPAHCVRLGDMLGCQ